MPLHPRHFPVEMRLDAPYPHPLQHPQIRVNSILQGTAATRSFSIAWGPPLLI